MNIHEVYQEMIEAANKATEASKQYRKREAWLKGYALEQIEAKQVILSVNNPDAEQEHIDRVKDLDKELDKRFSRYNFWRNEQIRNGELLKAHESYVNLSQMRSLKVWA